MLIYHPAFDIYNCIFRVLQLLSYTNDAEIEVDKLRIWDFYLTFPREVRKIKFPMELSALKKVFKEKEQNLYEDLIDPRRIMDRMKPYQLAALKALASYGFIDKDSLSKNVVKKTNKEIPLELKQQLSELSVEKLNILKLITGFKDLPLYGDFGLKARTGLIDFKYDAK